MPTTETIQITDESAPIDTAAMRQHRQTAAIYKALETDRPLPDVSLVPSQDPAARRTPRAQPVAIMHEGEAVGSFNLVQAGDRTWINDIEAQQGHGYGMAAYAGVIAAATLVGRQVESDPQSVDSPALAVWDRLHGAGLAAPIEDAADSLGNRRFRTSIG